MLRRLMEGCVHMSPMSRFGVDKRIGVRFGVLVGRCGNSRLSSLKARGGIGKVTTAPSRARASMGALWLDSLRRADALANVSFAMITPRLA